MDGDRSESRVFLTCSARARSSVMPLVNAAEQFLLDQGFRTRVQRWASTGEANTKERRRLRSETYEEVERSVAVIHVLAGAPLAGTRLHHALNRAVQLGVPVLLLSCPGLRDAHGLVHPSRGRITDLLTATAGEVIDTLDGLLSPLSPLTRAVQPLDEPG